MDLRQLAALLAVSEHGSFSSAAKALHTVQSNISTHVARLEAQLGVVLVDRQHGRLTDEGEVVVARARRIHAELEAIKADIASLGAEVAGSVRLGVISTIARWFVPPLWNHLRATHPRTNAIVVEASTTSLVPQLLSGRLDLAVLNLPLEDPDLSTQPLFDEDLVVVAPPDHPLAAHDCITLQELAEYQLLLSPQGTVLRQDLEKAASKAGVTLIPQAELDGVRLMASLALAGFGPAVLPATAVPTTAQGNWKRIAVEGLPRRQIGLAVRRRGLPSAPARAVAIVIRDVLSVEGLGQPGVHLVIA